MSRRRSKKDSVALTKEAGKKRSAGILCHISSLPGRFGIGDMGPEAKKFADFLHKAKQTYWQLLPLNPVEKATSYSPYSSVSSMAGNTMLISPEALVDAGWLSTDDLRRKLPSLDTVDFEGAITLKESLFDIAYQRFTKSKARKHYDQFQDFCQRNKHWVYDYALYVVIKNHHEGKPWYEWSKEYKNRDAKALKLFQQQNTEALNRVMWLQYVFFNQWESLKLYCNERGILLFGDLPFYVSYDSSDVWSYPEIFSLDKKGALLEVAGVPPDYFNEDGQRWGMPVFRWDVLKKQNFKWWVDRISQNMKMFDLLRLDHFRAFADYWAVDADEPTAKNGRWKKGPRHELFEAFRKALGHLPFVAEDLGDINEDVHQLRKDFELPGMKVLHFAFSENIHENDYIPHNFGDPNYIVYTGTHDNNTTLGWYRKDATSIEKENVQRYAGDLKISKKNINTYLISLAWSSIAKTAIIPIQDLLMLDETSRMNAPASTENNWQWRMTANAIEKEAVRWLAGITRFYNRT